MVYAVIHRDFHGAVPVLTDDLRGSSDGNHDRAALCSRTGDLWTDSFGLYHLRRQPRGSGSIGLPGFCHDGDDRCACHRHRILRQRQLWQSGKCLPQFSRRRAGNLKPRVHLWLCALGLLSVSSGRIWKHRQRQRLSGRQNRKQQIPAQFNGHHPCLCRLMVRCDADPGHHWKNSIS